MVGRALGGQAATLSSAPEQARRRQGVARGLSKRDTPETWAPLVVVWRIMLVMIGRQLRLITMRCPGGLRRLDFKTGWRKSRAKYVSAKEQAFRLPSPRLCSYLLSSAAHPVEDILAPSPPMRSASMICHTKMSSRMHLIMLL